MLKYFETKNIFKESIMKKFIERLILIITTFAFVSCGQKQMTQSEVKDN